MLRDVFSSRGSRCSVLLVAASILWSCAESLEEFSDLSQPPDLVDAGWEPGRIEFAERSAERFLREGLLRRGQRLQKRLDHPHLDL